MQAALIQHEAPFRLRRLAPESEEGKSGQFHHHGADIRSGRNDEKGRTFGNDDVHVRSAAADNGSFYNSLSFNFKTSERKPRILSM